MSLFLPLVLDVSANKRDGEIVNLMSSDSQRVVDLALGGGMHMVWTSPIIIICGVGLIYRQMGWASIIGFVCMLLFFPISGTFIKKQMICQKQAAAVTDFRVGLINEFIQGIRVVKFYAWEQPLLGLVNEKRAQEMKLLRAYLSYRAVNFGIMMLVPVIATIVIFLIYIANGGDMTADVVFTTMSYMYVIRFPFNFLPMTINFWVQTFIAFGRIEKFLAAPELHNDIEPMSAGAIGVELEHCDFKWDVNDKFPRLHDISLSARPGKLISIVGPVASGKSTLLLGLLGEVGKTAGKAQLSGTVAYVPQSAFIVNMSMRDNILFGQPYHKDKYERVIKACALESDFALMANGDKTEIGERGINISGGQKQRVSLARAAYNDQAQIVLLDDPLSAVDSHVAKHIFEQCINGLMKDKCRIFATHTLQFLSSADEVVMLTESDNKDCFVIGAQGKYNDLMLSSPDFKSLMETFNRGKEGDSAEEKKKEEKTAAKTESKQDEKKGALIEEEEREHGNVDAKVYRDYFRAGGSVTFGLLVALAFLICQGAQMGSDFWMASWTDDRADAVLNGQPEPHTTAYYLGIYAAIILSFNVLSFARSLSIAQFGANSAEQLHVGLIGNMLQKNMSFYDRTPVGRILNRFTKDMYVVDFNLSQTVEHVFSTGLQVLATIVVMGIIMPLTLSVVLVVAVLYYYIQAYYRRSSRELQRLDSISKTPIFTHFSELLGGVTSVRALGVQDVYVRANMEKVDENHRAFYGYQLSSFWLRLRLDVLGALVLFGSAVFAVLSYRMDLDVSPGYFGILLNYSMNVTQFLNFAVLLTAQIEAHMNSVERIRHYTIPTDHENWNAANKELSNSVQVGWPSRGKVEFVDYCMRYRPGLDLVIRNLSVVFPPMKKIGIVGRTGSGKSSTLVSLFRMVEPASGTIKIDDVDITQISLHDLRSNIAIIPQEPVLFSGTVRYNLDPFSLNSEEQLWDALEYVQLKQVVDRMPLKLENLIEEGGKNLSLGQRQLLCLARALLRHPKVVCLDEATANVDVQTDEIIQKAIRERFASSTVITIAHRLNTIMDYDLVLVLDQGRLVEFDSPEALRHKPRGVFAGMLHAHASSIAEGVN